MTTNDQERAKLIDKVRKLLALSQSPNEHEAMLAAEKAQALLAEHNLSMSELEQREKRDVEFVEDSDMVTRDVPYFRSIMQGCAKMYFCGYFFQRGAAREDKRGIHKGPRHNGVRHFLIGEKQNVVVAQLMATYLIATVRRLASQGAHDVPENERNSYKNSFKNAAAARLCRRMYQRAEQARNQGIQSSTGTTLPALRSMYDRIDDYLAAYFNRVKVKSVSTKVKPTHWKGWNDGREAGDSISLDTQVGSEERKRLGR